MKKLVTLLLTIAMVFSLVGCGAAGATGETGDAADSAGEGGSNNAVTTVKTDTDTEMVEAQDEYTDSHDLSGSVPGVQYLFSGGYEHPL